MSDDIPYLWRSLLPTDFVNGVAIYGAANEPVPTMYTEPYRRVTDCVWTPREGASALNYWWSGCERVHELLEPPPYCYCGGRVKANE